VRDRLAAEVAILKDLPENQPTRPELQSHVDYLVRTMLAEAEPWTARERYDRWWGLMWLATGVCFLGLSIVSASTPDASPAFLTWILALFGIGVLIAGANQVLNLMARRNLRKWDRRDDADNKARPRSE
jgi:hypothetical protein